MSGLAFGSPFLLLALVVLPAIWWLLRITPPRPQKEVFPPLKILASVFKREETPATSPWWLTLLRMVMAGLIILALADPQLDPRDRTLAGNGPLIILLDNGWATAPDWAERQRTADQLIDDAEAADRPVGLALTADPVITVAIGTASAAREKLAAAKPKPLKPRRDVAIEAIATALNGEKPGTIAFITDAIAAGADDTVMSRIAGLQPDAVKLLAGDGTSIAAITNVQNNADTIGVSLSRLDAALPKTVSLSALDIKGRSIATGTATFAAGATQTTADISAPFELRNDVSRIVLDGFETAGSTWLLDDGFKRRRVGLLSGESRDLSQPLLSPLYYIKRALGPFADLVEPTNADLAEAIPELLKQKPSVIVMADIGRIPDEATKPLRDWISNGGVLIRFAGPRLAAAPTDDPLVPVILRQGERLLGGALSWTEPQKLAAYPASSPFAGMDKPDNIQIKRQVLAEPSPDLADRTWASLEDGTPLVTEKPLGAGTLVLFHVSAEATWSDLPISGHFVEMLRRLVQLSRASGTAQAAPTEAISLSPWKLLSADGRLTGDLATARPLQVSTAQQPTANADHPPGYYGSEDGFVALNLMTARDQLMKIAPATNGAPLSLEPLAGKDTWSAKPWLLALATLLLLADTMIVLIMGGALRGRNLLRAAPLAAFVLIMASLYHPASVFAGDEKPGDDVLLSRLDTTHLAYVITGEDDVDRISERGLEGLSEFITYRTTLEPGLPVGVDIAKDELSVFPIIYWPISATAPMPSASAISRIDAYMKAGGTVLFDTRDQFSNLGEGTTSANGERLQVLLSNLDIPPLEPVPPTHVLTKSFYLLSSYPGRYAGSPLWVEASQDAKASDAGRPAATGDGVSPIMITANDFAGAWAVDDNGMPLLATVPPDDMQREYAFRSGVNIMMYMLTGNYKSDQVHVPALLERLGQ